MGTVRTRNEPRRLGQCLDAMSPDELARLDDAVIALDPEGHIVAITPAAARWIGVAAWQARGRTLTRELGWRFGKDATAAIAAFSGDTAPISTVHVREHVEVTGTMDFVPMMHEIKASYEAGDVSDITMHDGSEIRLHKLQKDWDPTDRRSAMNAVQNVTRDKSGILTGLLYIDESSQDLH